MRIAALFSDKSKMVILYESCKLLDNLYGSFYSYIYHKGIKMTFLKTLATVLLFLYSLAFPTGTIEVPATISCVGIFIPLLLQRMWFGNWFPHKENRELWKNILFSCLFIGASVFAADIFIMMAGVINKTGYDLKGLFLIGINRALFFFAMIYLWNFEVLQNKNKIFLSLYRILKIAYTCIGGVIITWMATLWLVGIVM